MSAHLPAGITQAMSVDEAIDAANIALGKFRDAARPERLERLREAIDWLAIAAHIEERG